MSTKSYEEEIKSLRKQRDEKTASDPLAWINLAGLFWLEDGENSFGSDENNKIFMPRFPHPNCGAFNFNGLVTLQPARDVNITINGETPSSRPLFTDREKTPDLLDIGPLTMKIIVRGDATLLRVWDREAPVRQNFKGFKYYPIDPEYCITAKYFRYDPPKSVKTLDIIGTEAESLYLGQAQFSVNGNHCTLEAEKNGEKVLFHFDDKTKIDTTYGGGRKFSVPIPQGDKVILDFNRAENWPCAYTPYATCPVTPIENRLSVRIEAGEMKYFE
jgi:uncharacterized protein (DUF1684 family)